MSDFTHGAIGTGDVDVFDRFDALDSALDDPEARKLVGAEPDSLELDAAEYRADLSPAQYARFTAIKDRLERLGYLRPGGAAAITAPDTAFANAVGWFQHDAMIKRDEWVGPQTWAALQAAFGLEGDGAMRQHLLTASDGQPTRLAWRAGLLRLALIGVADEAYAVWLKNSAAEPWTDTRGQITREAIAPGLNRLSSVLTILKAPGAPALSPVGLLGLVLDFDRVTRLLAQSPKPERDDLRRDKVEDLLGKAVTIELWARGFDLDLVDRAQLDQRTRIPRPSGALNKALITYLAGEGRALAEARAQAKQALTDFPALFAIFNADRDAGETADDAVEHQVERYFREDPARFEEGRSLLSKIGSRLWDGVKRAVGWLARLVRRGVEVVATTVKGTLGFFMRVGQRFARDGFHAVRRARQIIVESVKFFTNPAQTSPEDGIAWRRSLDGDVRVAVAADTLAQAAEVLKLEALRAQMIQLAGRLLGATLQLARTIVTGSVTGWLGFWLTLMRVVRRARPWIEQADMLWRKLKAIEDKISPATLRALGAPPSPTP